MRIILVRIPLDTKAYEINEFFEPVLKRRFFLKNGEISKIEFLRYYDTQSGVTEYHALVTIEPDSRAKRAIIKLNRKQLNGKHIAVREYHMRSWHNDPRQRHHVKNLGFANRRIADRRRKHLQLIVNEETLTKGQKNFHRIY